MSAHREPAPSGPHPARRASESTAGKLFLVATPIGNLQDITLRALETLKAVDVIAAEDTRRTRQLLSHFQIPKKTLLACNAHATPAFLGSIVERIERGESVALVTDAGTPSVSDPGTALVRAAVRAGVVVVPIPGVSAVTAAVAASGLVDGPFQFLGFPPSKGGERHDFFEQVVTSAVPVVFFEAPHRIVRTLEELASLAPDRDAVLCRELTKVHEELRRGSLQVLASSGGELRGEFTLVVSGAPPSTPRSLDPEALASDVRARLHAGESPRGVVDALVVETNLPRRELYRLVMELAARERADHDG